MPQSATPTIRFPLPAARSLGTSVDGGRLTLETLVREWVFQIACRCEAQDDAAFLRTDPLLKLICGRLPERGHDLASQPWRWASYIRVGTERRPHPPWQRGREQAHEHPCSLAVGAAAGRRHRLPRDGTAVRRRCAGRP
jgi:hypothetical protein